MRINNLGEVLDSSRFYNIKKHSRVDEAVRYLERALAACPNVERDPRHVECIEHLTHYLLKSGNLIAADQVFETVRAQIKPEDFSPKSQEIEARIQRGFSGITQSFNKEERPSIAPIPAAFVAAVAAPPAPTAHNVTVTVKKRRTFVRPQAGDNTSSPSKPAPEM